MAFMTLVKFGFAAGIGATLGVLAVTFVFSLIAVLLGVDLDK